MSSEFITLVLRDGRPLEVLSEGDPDGLLLIFHHGSPGSAVPFEAFDRAGAEHGIHLVAYSRPGFGGSTRDPGRTVASCVSDAEAISDHFGEAHCVTVGWSGGGPHAIACAALMPNRVLAAATIAGVAPYDAEGLDWTAGMGEDNQIEYPLAASDPDALFEWMEPHVQALSQVTPQEIVSSFRSLISGVDEASLTGEFGDFVAASFRKAFQTGPWGWYDDDLAFVAPWGFELADITVPISIWQGRQDLMVPLSHGEWLAANIPTARPQLRPEHGHLSLAIGHIGEILEDLRETASSGL